VPSIAASIPGFSSTFASTSCVLNFPATSLSAAYSVTAPLSNGLYTTKASLSRRAAAEDLGGPSQEPRRGRYAGAVNAHNHDLVVQAHQPKELTQLHLRLGHAGLPTLQKLVRERHVRCSADLRRAILAATSLHCGPCAQAKATRRPFPRRRGDGAEGAPPPPAPGRWSIDLAGPFKRSRGGSSYVSTLLHEPSGRCFPGFHASKSSPALAAHMDRTVPRAEYEVADEMAVLMSDQGSEWQGEFHAWCVKNGVIRRTTAPGSSEQNSRCERKIRTLRENCTANILSSGIPIDLWPEAWMYTCHTIDHLPQAGQGYGGQAPLTISRGARPSLARTMPFGCAAYAHTPPAMRRKADFSGRARLCVFLGYDSLTKDSYRLLHLASGRVIGSRSVTFLPNEFPLKESGTAEVSPSQRSADADPLAADQGPAAERRHSERAREQRQLFDASALEAARFYEDRARVGEQEAAGGVERPPAAQANATLASTADARTAAGSSQRADPPMTIAEALVHPDRELWLDAMQEEYEALVRNGTWEQAGVPPGKTVIPMKALQKEKLDKSGELARRKSRFVALGCRQKFGVDYFESFAPTLRWASFRTLIPFCLSRRWAVHQMDVSNAFLVPAIESEVYVTLPRGSSHFTGVPDSTTYRLKKCLYGLVGSPRAWAKHIKTTLRSIGFVCAEADPCLFLRGPQGGPVEAIIAVYCDDCVVAAPPAAIKSLKEELLAKYKMTDDGPLSWFLGVAVDYDLVAGTATLSQEAFARSIVARCDKLECRTVSTPMDATPPPPTHLNEEERHFMDTTGKSYASLVGALLYLSGCTRPDITYAVHHLARFMTSAGRAQWTALQRLLRYISGTADVALCYVAEEEKDARSHIRCEIFADADHAGDLATRRSTTAWVTMTNGTATNWDSKLQRTVALSSCEAELMSLASAVQEAMWSMRLLRDLYPERQIDPIQIWEDNQGTIALAKDRRYSKRTKHMDVRYFFVQEQIEGGNVRVDYKATTDQIADLLTKPLGRSLYLRLRDELGLRRKDLSRK
jgi:transposase InsO family protein